MRKIRVPILAALAAFTLAAAGCGRRQTVAGPAPSASGEAAPSAPKLASASVTLERGRMLVIGGGCHDCHTPKAMTPHGPEPDMTRQLSGHPETLGVPAHFKGDAGSPWQIHVNDHLTAWSGPWGVSLTANLTPDEDTGIGIWTEEMFLKALKTGKHMGTSRPILPPMPWQMYGQLPDEDLKAIYAYLRTIPPVKNRVPMPTTPDGQPIE